jgi:hypothetical protein
LAIAMLLVVALFMAACGTDGKKARGPADAPDSPTAASSTIKERTTSSTTAAPPPSIRTVDLSNATLPAHSCAEQTWLNPEPIPLSNGTGASGDKDADPRSDGSYLHAEANLIGEPEYLDIDGDGSEDAVVGISCSAGGNSQTLHVVVLRNTGAGLELVGDEAVHSVFAQRQGKQASRISSWSLDGKVVATEEQYSRTDAEPMCCLTGKGSVRWVYTQGGWDAQVQPSAGGPADEVTNANQVDPHHFRPEFASATSDTVEFATPSGNIECEWGGIHTDLICYASVRNTPPPPPTPPDCEETQSWVTEYVRLGETSAENGVCTGGVLHDYRQGSTLPYGSSLLNGDFGCLSEERGVTCVRFSTGRGFFLSKDDYRSW